MMQMMLTMYTNVAAFFLLVNVPYTILVICEDYMKQNIHCGKFDLVMELLAAVLRTVLWPMWVAALLRDM